MKTLADIAWARLYNEHLFGLPLASPKAVVGWLGAVQAQDYPAAKWALGQRVQHATDASIDQAYQDGRILRTHIMRPTWHFVLPEDIRWLLKLTSPRVHAFSAYYYRKEGLDDHVFAQSEEVLAGTLQGGNQATRAELRTALAKADIATSNLGYTYIIIHAELEGLLCSGVMKGKQHTYALLEERVPRAKILDHDASLAELARRYFISHGPAQVQDFAWWSGLTVRDAKAGLEYVKSQLISVEIDGKTYWSAPSDIPPRPDSPRMQLLPNYDESLVAYKDHAPSMAPGLPVPTTMLMNHVVVRNGQVIGGWRRLSGKNKTTVQVKTPIPLTKPEFQALRDAAANFEVFLGHPVELVTT